MSSNRQRSSKPVARFTFLDCLRKFLTPALWKQAHQSVPRPKTRPGTRWQLQPLLLTLLIMTWCTGDSQPERFETARAFYVALAPKRRRPGTSVAGFHKALARLPLVVLRTLAAGLRQQFLRLFGTALLTVDGFIPLGCDGSRLRCPRVAELEQRLGKTGVGEPPQVWVTALVHLRLGLLWSWWLGKGDASERQHLLRLLPTLPAKALVVTDAGYQGYEVIRNLLDAGVEFLMRVSTQTVLYQIEETPALLWSQGLVYWWTEEARRAGGRPLLLRLLRVRSPQRKVDVWLVSNVPSERLSVESAGRFYQMRWENEGLFRSYKRTLGKVKMQSRTVALVHREVEGSLLAMQLLLAQGAWVVAVLSRQPSAQCSPRGVLREIRRETNGHVSQRERQRYGARVAARQRKERMRTSSKVKRPWPGRKDHEPPKPPKLRKLTEELKAFREKELQAA